MVSLPLLGAYVCGDTGWWGGRGCQAIEPLVELQIWRMRAPLVCLDILVGSLVVRNNEERLKPRKVSNLPRVDLRITSTIR